MTYSTHTACKVHRGYKVARYVNEGYPLFTYLTTLYRSNG